MWGGTMSVCHGIRDGQKCTSTALIEAHIIPQGYARFIRQDSHNVVVTATGVAEAHPQLGIYDNKQILCADCDQILGVYDEYALNTCKEFDAGAIIRDGIWTMPNVDGDKFSKFILALLWRASITKRKEFAQVALGPYTDKARDVLFGVRPLDSLPAFEVMLCRYKSDVMTAVDDFHTLISCERYCGFRCYGIGLGGFQVLAKFDSQLFPQKWKSFIANGNQELRGIYKDMDQTNEHALMVKGIFAQMGRGQKTW
jgi:hypothetical protein